MSNSKVRVDKREWERIKKRLMRPRYQVNVGWFEGDRYGAENGNLPMAQVAKWVEEGHRGGWGPTPPRPAIRTIFAPDLVKDKVLSLKVKQAALQVANGRKNWSAATGEIADYIKKKLQKVLMEYNRIHNTQATIDVKGFDKPWLETGVLISSVSYKIERIDVVK